MSRAPFDRLNQFLISYPLIGADYITNAFSSPSASIDSILETTGRLPFLSALLPFLSALPFTVLAAYFGFLLRGDSCGPSYFHFLLPRAFLKEGHFELPFRCLSLSHATQKYVEFLHPLHKVPLRPTSVIFLTSIWSVTFR